MEKTLQGEIAKLKLMTMKPPVFAEEMLASLEAELMFGNPDEYQKEYLLRKINSLKVEIQVDLLPNVDLKAYCDNTY